MQQCKEAQGLSQVVYQKELAEKLVFEKVMTEMFTDDMIEDIAESLLKLQQRENTDVPLLQRQLADIEKGIENMLNAMQAGILTKSTKKRLDELEAQKEKLELDIMREQIQTEILTKDQIIFWLRKSKELDLTNDDNKRILIDTFISSINAYDDKLVVCFNTREKTSASVLLTGGCSDSGGVGAPV